MAAREERLTPGAPALAPAGTAHGASARTLRRVFSSVLRGYRDARRSNGEVVFGKRIAGRAVTFRCTDPAMADVLALPFRHLPDCDPGAPALTVCSWDSTWGLPAPTLLPPAVYYQPGSGPSFDLLSAHGLDGYAPRHRLAVRWLRPLASMPACVRAAPARRLLAWWLGREGLLCLHGAAVGNSAGMALIVGESGRGKSTTALASLVHGLDYLGDDFVAIDSSAAPVAHSLFSTARMTPQTRSWLPSLKACALGLPNGDGKDLLDLNRAFSERVLSHGPVRAILAPQFGDGAVTTVSRLSPGTALEVMARATMQLANLPPAALGCQLRAMGRLCQAVPCWRLSLGRDLAGVAAAVRETVERSTP